MAAPAVTELEILLIDDHQVFTGALAQALDAEPDLRCVAIANTARDGLAKAAAYRFDVAIVDLQLPDAGGLSVVAQLRALHPAARLLVLTGYPRADLAEEARRAGADDFLPKDDALPAVLGAIRGTARAAAASPLPARPVPQSALTAREHDVLELIALGVHAGDIAAKLSVSLHTIRGHIKAILAKLGVHSQLDAVLTAREMGLIDLGARFR